jgi:hypothetical protein
MRRKTKDNRDCADASMRDVPRLTLRVRCKNRDRAPNLVYRICRSNCRLEELFVADIVIKLRLNQQQLELMDRTIAQGVAPDRVSLVRLALREYAAARQADAAAEAAR